MEVLMQPKVKPVNYDPKGFFEKIPLRTGANALRKGQNDYSTSFPYEKNKSTMPLGRLGCRSIDCKAGRKVSKAVALVLFLLFSRFSSAPQSPHISLTGFTRIPRSHETPQFTLVNSHRPPTSKLNQGGN